MIDLIEKELDQHVRPILKEHYGDIKISGYENGILEIEMLGNCRSCPSAKYTVIDVVEVELKKHIPEIEQVILRESINEDMLKLAKDILNNKGNI
jgi:Fe-S cluster biogenesis protein NfuA